MKKTKANREPELVKCACGEALSGGSAVPVFHAGQAMCPKCAVAASVHPAASAVRCARCARVSLRIGGGGCPQCGHRIVSIA